MKFSLSTAPVAKTEEKVVKPFDIAAAEEAMLDSFERFSAASKKLAETQGSCEYLLSVVEDSKEAMESFQKFGAEHLEVVLNVYNGKDAKLDKALGLESLAVETLAKMDVAAKTLVKDQYTSALEANVGDAFKAFIEKVKAWLAQFMEWVKELFVGNAKMLKLIQETKFENVDQSAQLTGIKYENAKGLLEYIGETLQAMEKMNGLWDTMMKMDNPQDSDEFKEFSELGNDSRKKVEDMMAANGGKPLTTLDSGTVGELGWTDEHIKTIKEAMAGMINNKQVAELVKKFQPTLAGSINVALTGEKEKVDGLRGKFAAACLARLMVVSFNKMVRTIGVTLLRIAKKTGDATPAEGGEQKPAEETKVE